MDVFIKLFAVLMGFNVILYEIIVLWSKLGLNLILENSHFTFWKLLRFGTYYKTGSIKIKFNQNTESKTIS